MLVLVVLISVWHCVHTELCVLDSMVTQSHPKCQPPTNCTANHLSTYKLHAKISARSFVPLAPLLPGSPAFSHFQSVRSSDEDSIPVQIFMENGTKYVLYPIPVSTCDSVTCNATCKYRSYDGTNNNLNHTDWGKTNTAMLRFVVPRYSGPKGQVALSINGTELPNSRLLSTLIFPDMDRPSLDLTLSVMQWGQLLAHDMGLTPNPSGNCCTSVSALSDLCMAIKIPTNDSFYSKFNETCMNMIRSDSVSTAFGCLDFPDQISSVTHIIDLSLVYGSNKSTALSLRQCEGGLLQISTGPRKREYLPLSFDPVYDCNVDSNRDTCFRAGDTRVNQNTQLTCLQIIMLREHNRLAKGLTTVNPDWEDERLYQEARAILIATFQHISYNEWLPMILGEDYMDKHNLFPLKYGYSNSYDATVNPSTINSFMSAAFRVFHSGIQGRLQMINGTTRCPYATLNISDWMLKPGIIIPNSNLDELLLGLTVEPVQEVNRFFTTQMTEMMFHNDLPYGEDLESFDIQRGRDHGTPTYNVMRELCHMSRANTFSDLLPDMGQKHVELLKRAYDDVDDIDYFIGGILEQHIQGTPLGPTFHCIIAEQFVRKKIGDRFWYENGNQLHSFSKAQLQEIRKASLSRLLCDNADNITQIQPSSFHYVSKQGNSIVPCSCIPSLNLTAWIDSETASSK